MFGITIVYISGMIKTKSKNMNTTNHTLFAILLCVIAFLSVSNLKAQDVNGPSTIMVGDNLYVVVQRSDMCKMCEDNYDRWNTEIISYYSGRPSIIFMNYDITNERTIEDSKADIDKYGLTELLNANKRPGRVFLIDPDNKQIVKMLDIDLSTTDIRNYINEAAPMTKPADGIK